MRRVQGQRRVLLLSGVPEGGVVWSAPRRVPGVEGGRRGGKEQGQGQRYAVKYKPTFYLLKKITVDIHIYILRALR